jgi:hypothetical protein
MWFTKFLYNENCLKNITEIKIGLVGSLKIKNF